MEHMLLLNGDWKMDWLCDLPYADTAEPHPFYPYNFPPC